MDHLVYGLHLPCWPQMQAHKQGDAFYSKLPGEPQSRFQPTADPAADRPRRSILVRCLSLSGDYPKNQKWIVEANRYSHYAKDNYCNQEILGNSFLLTAANQYAPNLMFRMSLVRTLMNGSDDEIDDEVNGDNDNKDDLKELGVYEEDIHAYKQGVGGVSHNWRHHTAILSLTAQYPMGHLKWSGHLSLQLFNLFRIIMSLSIFVALAVFRESPHANWWLDQIRSSPAWLTMPRLTWGYRRSRYRYNL